MSPWVQTYTGVAFDLANPRPEDVNATDISVALSRIVRYNGHTAEPYTVAQHSVLVSRQLAAEGHGHQTQLAGLLHDAHEAYIGDIVSPVLKVLGGDVATAVSILTERIDGVIAEAANIGPNVMHWAMVREADRRMLLTEARDLMLDPPRDWGVPGEPYPNVRITPWGTARALDEFYGRLIRLSVMRLTGGRSK